MPITSSAKKALRASLRKRDTNVRLKSKMDRSMKDVKRALRKTGTEEANKLLSKAYQSIDKAMKKGYIKKNAAARKKARLTAFVRKAAK